MITNEIIKSFIICKYKAYNMLNSVQGIKKDYELMQTEIANQLFSKFAENVKIRFGDENQIVDLKLVHNEKISKIILEYHINFNNYDLLVDAIEVNCGRLIPYLFLMKEKISKYYKLLLTVKCLLFTKMNNVEIDSGRIYYGKDMKTLKFKIQKLIPECLRIISDLENLISFKLEPVLCQNNHCKICEYEELCHKKLVERDDLSLLSSIDEKDLKRYEKKGIFTIKQLSYTFKLRKRNERVNTRNHPYYDSLKALALRERKVYVFDKIEIPNSETKIFLDCEGDTENSFIYLIGILIEKKESIEKYSFWANTKEEESNIFDELYRIINSHREAKIFYYGKYDWRVLKKIISQTNNVSIKKIISENSVDILAKIRRNIYFPTYSNSLKEIARFMGFSWTDIQASGLQSVVWRYEWEKLGDISIKKKLITYNSEDCEALQLLVRFLVEVFNNEIQNNDKVAFIEHMDPKENQTFKNMTYATEDVKIITQGAYFQYQRNKIYWRTNENIKKIKRKNEKVNKIKIKVNKTILIKTNKCSLCKSKNISKIENDIFKITVLDLRISQYGIKKWIIQYDAHRYICNNCENRFLPAELKKIKYYSRKDPKLRGYIKHKQEGIGHTLLVWIIHQFLVNYTTFRSIEKSLKYYFKIPLDHRQIWEVKRTAATYYNKTFEEILQNLIKGKYIHIDETKVKLKTTSGYIWVFSNMDEVIYLYKPNREAAFLKDLLKDFKGVLISDFYPGYDSLDCPKQKCLVHLIRDLNDTLLKNPFNEELKSIVVNFGALLRNIIFTSDKYGLKRRHFNKHKKDVLNFFEDLKNSNIVTEEADKLRKKIISYDNELFTFLDYDNVPWNNNNAEYAIKQFADYRQTVKGSITEKGLVAYLTLLSIYQTCNYKGINFLNFLLSKQKYFNKKDKIKSMNNTC
ncbi:MAG: TM0106 family RecB-like putative nuclease [Nanoarchaeota archaeon]|nr:TM0106 family RecB-like putative nuclease [Nanoarchaeota archaeon]MBU1269305.1 TM0106 family RecB-like putative nuclease [Nanoarchaeota archaeon]MBU2443883.1 TM0106 family RecB-like putative nuclease [Nanoarchaeota archaeon]